MKISNETIELLKNYATINRSLKIDAGDVVQTISPQRNIFAKSKVKETFPREFAIYDLTEFLGLASLFSDADFDFGDKKITITEGNSKAHYTYTDPSMVTSAPKKEIKADFQIECSVSKETMKQVLNGANQLNLPQVVVRNSGKKIEIAATEVKNPTSNEFVKQVEGKTNDAKFNFVMKTENIKLLAKDYTLSLSEKGIAKFVSADKEVEYWVAIESTSTYSN